MGKKGILFIYVAALANTQGDETTQTAQGPDLHASQTGDDDKIRRVPHMNASIIRNQIRTYNSRGFHAHPTRLPCHLPQSPRGYGG